MIRCPACSYEAPEDYRYCPRCSAPLVDVSAAPTRTSAPRNSPPHPAPPVRHLATDPSGGGRFLPGTVVSGRYRVVSLLGRGGMGEVYRADDLKLGQAVALKFLPARVEEDDARLQRLLTEVKIARQISHPGVCRVYDVGEAEGHHFISMEYVDGEDLASLLRRIGRLPRDKAVQIARQLCAGLAAAHDQGVLHRDLKPANVMIDGRGRARISDFGIAAFVEDDGPTHAGAGTPAYMAPEQRARQAVTVRSDIYALGLVLYELFTGQRPFKADTPAELARLQDESTPTSPTSLVAGLDPSVERAILRCLEKDPARRPASAMAVAASLPGGDPLAAALAAGETPSPEMVAAAGEEGALRPAVAWTGLAFVLAGLALVLLLMPQAQVVDFVGLPKSPEVLAERARDIARKFGYPELPVDEVYGFDFYFQFGRHIEATDQSPDRWKALGGSIPTGIIFWYRSSPRYMTPSMMGWLNSSVGANDPPVVVSGMQEIELDPRGRLLHFQRVPPQRDETEGSFPEPDWSVFLNEAELRPADLRAARPIWNPPMTSDARAAWDWTDPKRPGDVIRLEAAAYRGKPIEFTWWTSWEKPYLMEETPLTTMELAGRYVVAGIIVVILLGGGMLARRNLRLGRGDTRGATKLASFLFAGSIAYWLLITSHVPQLSEEFVLFVGGLGAALLLASILAVAYLALEPVARKLWPQILISWNRLLAGGLRDPLVGRDLLLGCLAGTWIRVLVPLGWGLNRITGYPPPPPRSTLWGLLGVRDFLAAIVWCLTNVWWVVVTLFLLVVFRMILRKTWAAAAVVLVLEVVVELPSSGPGFYPSSALEVLAAVAMLVVLFRLGLLAALAANLAWNLVSAFPMPSSLSAWYAGPGLFALAIVAAMAAYGFRASLGGRPALGKILSEAAH
jgi:predicted Ser/Thr protein kinase